MAEYLKNRKLLSKSVTTSQPSSEEIQSSSEEIQSFLSQGQGQGQTDQTIEDIPSLSQNQLTEGQSLKPQQFDIVKGEAPHQKHGTVTGDALQGKLVALLFSASWCPPCHKFLPILNSFYQQQHDEGGHFEVVFVSLDNSEEEMMTYYLTEHGNWLALPFEDNFKSELITQYHVTAIPKLVVIRQNGEIITLKGRKDIRDKGALCFKSWLNNSIPKEDQNKQNGAVNKNDNNVNLKGDVTLQEIDNLESIGEVTALEIIHKLSGEITALPGDEILQREVIGVDNNRIVSISKEEVDNSGLFTDSNVRSGLEIASQNGVPSSSREITSSQG